MTPVRVGFIGTGFIANGHAESWRRTVARRRGLH
jgi:predicted dehydrogenase